MNNDIRTEDILTVLEKYNLIALLPAIVQSLKQSNRYNAFRDTVEIASPFPLADDAVASIKRIIGNDLAAHTIEVKKELLAGFQARFRGKLYDASASRIIKQLQ